VTLAAKPIPVLIVALVACAVVVAGAMLLAPVLGAAMAGWSPAVQEAAFAVLLYGMLAVIGLVGRRLAGLTDPGSPASWIVLGAAVGVGGLLLTLGDAALAGSVGRGTAGGTPGVLLLGSLVMLGQAASEEVFFRGWLQPVLARAWGPAAAIGITAAAFAGLHIAGGERTPVTLVNLALGGLLFGLLAWRSGGIAASIAAHAGWNWSEGIVFGLDPNPGAGSFGAIHDLDLAGASLWGGSGEGLNASIAMTLVLAAFLLPLAFRIRSSSSVRG
jgi:hypothetical protein